MKTTLASAQAERLLVADDYPGAAELMSLLLQMDWPGACVVDVAEDGERAVTYAEANRPSAAVLDVDMPILDGIGAARAIRGMYPAPPPVLVALTGGTRSYVDAVESGAFDHVMMKPAVTEELIRLMRKV